MPIEANLAACIRASLKLLGYKLLPGSCDDDLRFKLIISSGARYRAQILIYDDCRVATLGVFISETPVYHVSYKRTVSELAQRMSAVVVFGGIYVQVESGAVLFNHAFDAGAIAPSIEAITRWINQSAFPLSVFGRAYNKVLKGVEAYPALQASLVEENVASDRRVVSKATRLALMEVSDGSQTNNIERNVRILCDELERARPVTLKLLND